MEEIKKENGTKETPTAQGPWEGIFEIPTGQGPGEGIFAKSLPNFLAKRNFATRSKR